MSWHNMISSPIALQLFYVLEDFTKYFTLLFAVFTEFPYHLQNNSKAPIFLWDFYLAVAFCIMKIPHSCLDIKQTNLIHYSFDFKSCNRLWTHFLFFLRAEKKMTCYQIIATYLWSLYGDFFLYYYCII